VTLTNHTKRIDELTGAFTILVDNKKYEDAHIVLDEIQSKVQSLRRHIDNLQNITRFTVRPAGEG